MQILESFSLLVSLGAIFLDIIFVVHLFLFLVPQKNLGKKIISFIKEYALVIIFTLSFSGLLGSLIYSEVIGIEPCLLCWYQRIFLYPIVLLSLVGIVKKDGDIFDYIKPMAWVGGVIALYHTFIQYTGYSPIPCSATGPSCISRYVFEFGFVTIPLMSLTLFSLVILVSYISAQKRDK